ncbi:MAG TPA: hypothetical protein VFJ96_08010 [Gemmatimonadaceae bacterium]|jgi:hypothetical protein|nr:hypothetical protein [Gemmatimonadaceae bacterium]
MPIRTITIDGAVWKVTPSGRVTQYDRDEFALIFAREEGNRRELRVTRYSPQGSRWRDQSLAELTDDDLRRLFAHSQPSFTSPEVGYVR